MANDDSPRALILASQSPRRKTLLSQTGHKFSVIPANIEEPPPGQDQTPESYAQHVARLKAEQVARRFPDRWVIGADTIVVINNQILGKPVSPADARRMLRQLGGHCHRVMTGCAIICKQQINRFLATITTQVTFKPLSTREIDWYISSGEPFDKAGAYAIQEKGAQLVRKINGSYTNVVGLPVCEVVEFLNSIGLSPFSAQAHKYPAY